MTLYENSSSLSEGFLISGIFFLSLGFIFKLALFPCHMWVPDVYEGASYETLLLFAVIVKLVIFFLFLKLFFNVFFPCFYLYKTYMLFICCGSMLVGCLGSLAQTKLKRFLAYSSMNQLSLFLLSIISGDIVSVTNGIAAMLIYSVTLFLVICIFNKVSSNGISELVYFKDLKFIKLYNKSFSYILVFLFSSLAGLPPFVGFFTKFYIILDFIQNGYFFLSIFILCINFISAYYYLKIIKCLFFEEISVSSFSQKSDLALKDFWEKTSSSSLVEEYSFFFFFNLILVVFFLRFLPSFYLFISYLVLDQFVLDICLHYNNF